MTPADDLERQRYLDRCTTLLIQLDGVVASDTLTEAQHLIDHGEPSIGIEYLAHGLVSQGAKIPAQLVAELRDLVLDESELPPNLDERIES